MQYCGTRHDAFYYGVPRAWAYGRWNENAELGAILAMKCVVKAPFKEGLKAT
jgi:hypothetical protein